MDIFKNKPKSNLDDELREQAKKLGLSLDELKKLSVGKSCPKYGNSELLHARKVRGGKIVVFNISVEASWRKDIDSGERKISNLQISQTSVKKQIVLIHVMTRKS